MERNSARFTGKEKSVTKNNRFLFFSSLGILFTLMVFGYFKLVDHEMSLGSSKITQVSDLVNKVRKLEDNIQSNQNDILALVHEYRDKTGENLPTLDMIGLSEEERLLLEEKISSESNISIKNLLSEILTKKNEIIELNMHIREIEAYLPKPHIVSEGENHYQVAMDYLMNIKGVGKDDALNLVERTLLFEPLVPGFKIWNFYSNGEFGSFVSQGSATISPNEVNRREKRKLTDARDSALLERDLLARDVQVLKERKIQILNQINLLDEERKHLHKKLEELQNTNKGLVESINSIHYLVDLKSNLLKGGVLKGGFLRTIKLQAIQPDLFSLSNDLREASVIQIDLSTFNIKKVRNIRIFPKFFKADIDYAIRINNESSTAEVRILNRDKFKNERIVISIE